MKATIWSKTNCSYCDQAKKLLTLKGISFEEKVIGKDATREELLEVVPTAKTVPQIFLDGSYIGGFAELKKFLGD